MSCSAALVEHLLTLQGKDHLVAVVPLLLDPTSSTNGRRPSTVDYDNLDTEALNSIGTAARVIQLTRVAQVYTSKALRLLALGQGINLIMEEFLSKMGHAEWRLVSDLGRPLPHQNWEGYHQLSKGVLDDISDSCI